MQHAAAEAYDTGEMRIDGCRGEKVTIKRPCLQEKSFVLSCFMHVVVMRINKMECSSCFSFLFSNAAQCHAFCHVLLFNHALDRERYR